MARKTVADLLVEVLADAGARRIYGVAGDSLNGITDLSAPRTIFNGFMYGTRRRRRLPPGRKRILPETSRCAGSCGPGNLHLINGLYDCHRNRVPVVAIAAQVPSNEIGSGYFQETHPEHLFAQCSHYCELISQPEQMPRVLEIAMQTAIARRGVAVIALPGDVALRAAVKKRRTQIARAQAYRLPFRD